MSIKSESIKKGVRLQHAVHGDGWVVEVAEAEGVATIEFLPSTSSWRGMLRGENCSGNDLRITVPIDALLTGEQWRSQTGAYESIDSIFRDIAETVGRTRSSVAGLGTSTSSKFFLKALKEVDLTDLEGVVGGIKAIVDWAVETRLLHISKSSKGVRLDTLRSYVDKLGLTLWTDEVYPSISPSVRELLDTLMVRAATELAPSADQSELQESARRLLGAVEIRLHLVHGRKFLQALSETQYAKGGSRTQRRAQ